MFKFYALVLECFTDRNTCTNRNDDQSHDVTVNIEDAARATDQGDHSETQESNPEDRRQEAHQVVLPGRTQEL